MEITLSKRLQTILEMINGCDRLIDVGTDHAFIPIKAIIEKRCKSAIALDIVEGPLEIAKKNIERYEVTSHVKTLKSNGLDKITPNENDIVVMAGMGGFLINELLLNKLPLLKQGTKFILQPMSAFDVLREMLFERGFSIKAERYICEGDKPYVIMYVVYSKEKTFGYSKVRLFVPLDNNIYDSAFNLYIKKVLRRQKKVLKGLIATNETKKVRSQKKLIEELNRYEECSRVNEKN